MKYYLDTEFNGYRGELISLALVREDGPELYLVTHRLPEVIPWVKDNVIPVLFAKSADDAVIWRTDLFGEQIANFMREDLFPVIIADWPDDIRYFCECLITGPGKMVDLPADGKGAIDFVVERVDSYPSRLREAVQHNALWDARALQMRLNEGEASHFDKWQPA
jgi:hypothetical protein